MIVGESAFFRVYPVKSMDITSYSAYYTLLLNGEILVSNGEVNNTGSEFKIELQTAELKPGNYEVRVFISDPVDGFIEAYRKGFLLEK